MRHLLGLVGLAVALAGWTVLLRLASGGPPYLDKDAGTVMGWLLFSPGVLCLLPLACRWLPRHAVVAIWLVALAPVAGAANFLAAVYLGAAAPESRLVVWVLSACWASPLAALAWRAWRPPVPSRGGGPPSQ